ncbi:hypothetical protein F7725_028492 [Dissostichus mawsoni]|uniref:Uncharacterized protein n=1 Tax=Dissostichus mawsoni TaxID=36200 RepID=A0A7J5XFX7_DISMA|nr:hypothetical protein F7725_028492 [Dissostichus mawsoni]
METRETFSQRVHTPSLSEQRAAAYAELCPSRREALKEKVTSHPPVKEQMPHQSSTWQDENKSLLGTRDALGVDTGLVVVASTWSSSAKSSSGSSPSPIEMVELASLELMRLIAASLLAELRLLEMDVRESDFLSCRRLPNSDPRRKRPFFLVTTSLSEWKFSTKPPRLPAGASPGKERSCSTLPLLCSERSEAKEVRRGERITVAMPYGTL